MAAGSTGRPFSPPLLPITSSHSAVRPAFSPHVGNGREPFAFQSHLLLHLTDLWHLFPRAPALPESLTRGCEDERGRGCPPESGVERTPRCRACVPSAEDRGDERGAAARPASGD